MKKSSFSQIASLLIFSAVFHSSCLFAEGGGDDGKNPKKKTTSQTVKGTEKGSSPIRKKETAKGLNALDAARGGNGSRGGGDKYALEVLSIARNVTTNIREWNQDLTPPLTEAEIRKVEHLFDFENAVDPNKELVEVLSFDRVYKHPEFLPDPKRAEEVALVNIYDHVPPRIEVGRILWDAIQDPDRNQEDELNAAEQKEVLVRHELFGAAGLLKKGKRIDDQYGLSYQLRLKRTHRWNAFKDRLRVGLSSLAPLCELGSKLDVSHAVQLGAMLQALPEYDKVLHPELYVRGNAKKIKNFQIDRWNEIAQWMNRSAPSLTDGMQSQVNRIRDMQNKTLDAMKAEWKNSPPEWAAWADSVTAIYTTAYQEVLDKLQAFGNQTLPHIESICGDRLLSPVEKLLPCFAQYLDTPTDQKDLKFGEVGKFGIKAEYEELGKEGEVSLKQALQEALDRLNQTVSSPAPSR